MIIAGKTILITGASGGIGSCLLDQFISRKAKKIYAADLNKDSLEILKAQYGDIIAPIKLDVTNQNDVQSCRNICEDIDILINNAGVEYAKSFLSEGSIRASSIEMAVNYFGVHNLCFSFWDALKEKESPAIINILSIASFSLILKLGTYCASKAAAHFLTQGLRNEAITTNIKIFGVYPGYVDTNMTKNLDVVKATPQDIAANICNDVECDILDIFPDAMSKNLSKQIDYKSYVFS